ncbi:GGDEF domain-containing protein [Actinoplanes sp. TRM 88003]|uniref:GGDEF domain-containing protein n=1 Tax=Paractinoplanes aksuensis TaxID=2939490 RepID=A0ABT1DEC3_9ACTN|nr:GGDEF domain-containing protein [Actinoplanes aksuensis]MCO8269162.1 GGDEF domain-containing protein [Actinoplanes aksuensis]
MIAAVLWTLAGCVALFALSGRANEQVQIFWFFQPPLDALLAWSSWQVARRATGALRRFWLVMAFVGALVTIGDTVQTGLALAGREQWSTSGGTVQAVCFTIGLAALILAMLAHPMPGRTRREQVAFWLDAATVLVAGAVVAWCYLVGPDDVLNTMITGAAILTSGFAAVKLVLSGNAPMHKAVAWTLLVSAVVNATGVFMAPGADGPMPAYVYAVRLLPSLLIAAGPRLQELLARFDENVAFGARRRKPYSLLPYGSIAVAFTAMLTMIPEGPHARLWGAAAGLGLIFALVVCRQLSAFHENKRLIDQLDATLADLREHEVRLRHQAQSDGLTGLANRTCFHEEVAAELSAPTGAGLTSVMIIDLDGFKAVNDTLGHAAGDTLLAGVADRLRDSVRTGDLVARLGGDEFAVLLRDCGTVGAAQTADRILHELTSPIPYEDTVVRANASIGIACAEPGDDATSLLRSADVAMYAAKHAGKGSWKCYDPSGPQPVAAGPGHPRRDAE